MLYIVLFGESFITFYADSDQEAEKLGRQLADGSMRYIARVIAN